MPLNWGVIEDTMKELKKLKPLLKKHKFMIEITYYSKGSFNIAVVPEETMETFITLYDRPIEEMVCFLVSHIGQFAQEASEGVYPSGGYSWRGDE